MDWKLAKYTRIMKETAAEICPVKVLRKEVMTWMTSEIRNLRRRRNRARRDLTHRRGEWVALCGELKDKMTEAKRKTWRRHLEKIREKNMSRAWSVVKQLREEKQSSHGGAMMYKGRWRTTPKEKANAFMLEYANIIRGKTDRGTKAERRRVTKYLKGARPRREVERDFTRRELERYRSTQTG